MLTFYLNLLQHTEHGWALFNMVSLLNTTTLLLLIPFLIPPNPCLFLPLRFSLEYRRFSLNKLRTGGKSITERLTLEGNLKTVQFQSLLPTLQRCQPLDQAAQHPIPSGLKYLQRWDREERGRSGKGRGKDGEYLEKGKDELLVSWLWLEKWTTILRGSSGLEAAAWVLKSSHRREIV